MRKLVGKAGSPKELRIIAVIYLCLAIIGLLFADLETGTLVGLLLVVFIVYELLCAAANVVELLQELVEKE